MLKLCKQAQKCVNYFSFNHGCGFIREVVAIVAHAEAVVGSSFKFSFVFGFMLAIYFFCLIAENTNHLLQELINQHWRRKHGW